MKNTLDFLIKLKTEGIMVSLSDGNIKVMAKKGASLSEAIKAELSERKTELIAYLKNKPVADVSLIPAREAGSVVPLSFSQERLWVIDQLQGSAQYHIPAVLRLKGRLDIALLEMALGEMVNRHHILRTLIHEKDGVGYQEIGREHSWSMEPLLLMNQQDVALLTSVIAGFIERPFLLSLNYPFRVQLIQISDVEHILVLVMHHIASDGASVAVFIRELSELYQAKLEQRVPVLPLLGIQYADYACWQRAQRKDVQVAGLAYWKQQLTGVPVLELPADYLRPVVLGTDGAQLVFQLPDSLGSKLEELALREGVTLYMLLLASFKVLLHRYSGQDDICVGTPVAGRSETALELLIGFFVNTLAIRTRVPGNASFAEMLQRVKEEMLAAYTHQAVPFEQVVEAVETSRDISRHPLFQVMFSFIPGEQSALPQLGDVVVSYEAQEHKTAKFDLNIEFEKTGKAVSFSIEYNTSLYKASRIERMGAHLVNILQAVVCDPQQRIRDIVYLSASEEQEVLQFSGEVHAVPDDLSVPVILHEVVQLHGDAIALSDGAVSYTYTELWHRSGLLSGFLQQECHVWPESLVGIVMGRGTGFVLAMTGILRSGAGYLPIESHLPQDRIRRLLKAGGVSVVVTDNADVASWLGEEFTCVLLSDALSKGIATPDDAFRSSAASLAYIMFTSGSTGEPKGVMVEHRSIVRLVKDTNYVSLNSSDRILQTGSLSFDAATFEIWGALLNGGAVYVTALENLLDATELAGYISGYGISCMWFTSSWFNQLADESPALFAGLKQVLVGGEQLSVSHVGKVMHHCPAVRIVNGYGPTENTTFSVCGEVLPSDIAEGVIRLGYPVSKSRVYITDVYGKLVGKGVYGELLLGGEGVSRGYLNDALRTETSFIANPFVPGERVYRSGDIGCWDEDGRILFRGRRDNQVKIRGYRVEPQEIARVLEEHESVREAAVKVVVSAVGDKQLAAYYTGEEGAVAAIRLHLEKHLPSYMRPAYLQWLPVFVLNANGKTDMGALPAPVMEEVAYIAASSELESYLVEVWSEVLHIATTDLSVEANFFELGGQSLKAIALIGRIHRDRGIKIPLVELFTHATIRGLAGYLSVQSHVVYAGLVAAPVSDYYPVSYAQRRMYLLQQFDTFSTAYNIPLQLPLPGGYGIEEVGAALQALVNRHEILRTSFEEREGVPVQVVQASVKLEVKACEKVNLDAIVAPFDLSVAPLLRAGYCKGALGGVLLLDIHHIITDGLSQAILQDELMRILSGEVLAPVVFQYKDYAVYEQGAAGQLQLSGHGDYWADRFSGDLPVLELPVDFARPEVRSLQGTSLGIKLSAEEVLFLRRLCNEEEVTLYMAGLSLWLLLLWRVSGQDDVITGTPVSGRQHADLSGIVGLFVNTLAIRNKITGSQRYDEFLKTVKNNVLSDFEHEDYPFELLLEAVWPHRDRSRHPLFDTMFSVQNKNAFWKEVWLTGEQEEDGFDQGEKFDLNLRLVEYGEDVYLHLGYNTTLFTVETAHALLDGYRELLASLQADKLQYLFDLQLLSPASRLLLSTAALLDSVVPANTYSNVFEARAAKSGDTIAVKDENGFLSYADLNYKANQLAHYLHNNGIATGSVVGVLLPPCKEMMVGIIGIFKAGCAYLPIDTSQPASRIEHILSDSDVDCVVTVGELPEGLQYSGMIVDLLSPFLQEQPVNNLLLPQDVDQLAYVIYTSGSTGRPKGVPIAQKSLMNYVNWFIEEVQYDESDSTILTSSFSFDLGHTVLFPVLLCGGCLHIVSKDLYLSPSDLSRYVQSAGISFLKFTPTLFSMLLNSADFEPSWLSGIRILMLGGEMIHVKDVGRFLSLYPDKYVLNSYGPAEATAGSVYKRIDRHNYDSFASRVVIGSPIPNMRAYILDKHHHVQPAGLPGEIYLSGIGLSAGYYHRDDLTVARFIEHPFYPGERLYATGDLGKYTASGELVCFGRSDHQVKIRGYRVELSEIEQCIISSGIVQECCVVYRTDSAGDGFLAAFVTDENVDIIQLRGFLELNLPDYMVPRSVVRLVQLPLTANGKTDRQQLGVYELGLEEGGSGAEYVAASGGLELELQRIWEEVLDVHPVSVAENFFRLGGHSLKALRVLNAVSRDLEMKLTLNEFFRYPVIRDLSAYLSGKDKVGYEAIAAAPVLDYYPLSHAQKRLWILQQLTTVQQAYNIPYYIHVKGILDPALLQDALQQLVNRHEVLRTVFDVVNDEPVQKIIPASLFSVNLLYDDVSGSADALFLCDEIAASESGYAFDLLNGPLLRVRLVKTGNASSALCFTLHHIVFDGWSVQVLLGELLRVYHGLATGNTYRLPELDIQYKDYAVWQEEQLLSGKFSAARSYWHQLFSGELPVLELPADYPRAAVKNYEGKSYRVSLPASVNAGLTAYSAEAGVSLFMLLLSGVQILLSKYSGQEDIIVGTPVSGRDHAGLADQIGFYVNTLAIRGYIDGNQSFEEYIQVLKDRLLAAYDHQGYPFDKLVEELGVSGDGSRSPLFDVMVVMEHAASTESLFEKNKLEVFPGESVTTTSKFDLTFHFTESSAEISLGIEYNTSLYKCSRIERMVGHLVNILNAIANNAKQRIGDMVYLSAAEEQELRSFSGEVSVVSEALSVPALLYEMVQQHGDAIALSDGITNYTYDEFWNKSGRIAGYLQQQCKVKPEALVGIVMDKGPDFILAMAGILRSGAAYLPIESHLPEDRIRLLLKVGGVAAVLTNNTAIAEMVSDGYMPCVDIQVAMREGAQVSQVAISKSSLAYVMFTSGSTGEPKGVMIEHRGIVRLVRDTNYVRLNNKDKILQGGSLTFDVATFEIWGALLNGGTLYITALEHLLDTTRLRLFIQQYGITRMWFTSSWFNQLADEDPSLFSSLQQILVGGEQLSVVHVGKVMASCPHLVVTNGYGPTEDTTFAVCGDVRKEDILSGIIRLGKPISKSRTYIVDKHGNLAGKGVYGELLLGGEGISRGYLNDALRTAAAFVANPFVPGERVYRSGDIGCWDEDGRIIFRGRRDNQVKIRGYRVEPLEIARVLEKHEAVREAAVKVVVGAGGDKQLAAYYTGEANAVATIRLYLEKHLPSYMRPTYLQWLPVFALNASGKTDMKALPAPVMEETSYTAAATEWEVYLVNVWSEVLHISAAGLSVEANFFELGGQSLKAIALIGRIHRDRGVKIPLVELFTHATIRGLAGYLSVQSQVVYTGLVVAPVNAYYPVSYAQRRMYLLQQFDTFSTAYNIPLQLPLPDGYSIEEVSVALQKLVNRHEVLRTSFEEREGVPVQVVHASVTLELNAYDGVEADGFVMPFDLSVAPLLRAGYYNSGNRIVLLLDIHHIITDGLSQAILQDEFIRLLSGEVLAPVPFQYKDYAVYEQSAAGQLQLAGHSEYWASRLSGELPVLELPVDFARSEVRSLQGASTEVRLNTDEVLFLRGLCSEEGVTLYMAGLSLWSLLLWRVSGQEDIITGTPVSGRQHADLAGIAGLFVNTLAIRNKITESQRYKEFLKTVKNNVLSDFEHEGYPFELLLEAVWPYRDRSRHPLFDTMFSVQNKNAFWQEMGEDDEVSAEISEAFFTDRGGKFDLNLRLVEYGEDVYLHLGYNTTLFTAETAHALLDGYRELMASLQADKLQYLFDLQLLSTASRLLLSTAALLDSVVPANTYSNVFEARAAKSGDAIAVKDENGFLSYADLNYKANQLAHYLHNNGIATGSVVGVLLPPCKEMMVGIIGIFKAGCAYLPIDISQPAARIEHILSDSDVDCVVTVGELPEGLEYSGMIVDLLSPVLQEQPVNNLLLPQDADQLAYVIYTSGSTGRPKGVPIAQKSLMNYVNWFIEEVQYDESDSTILTSSFSFDLGHTVLFPVLLCGGCLHIVSKDLYLSPADLCRYVQSAGISFLKFTPTLFSMLLNSADFEPSWLSGIRILMLGGEMIHVKDVGRFLSLYPDKYVLNSYGPAEATAGSVYKRIDCHNYDSFASRVVIGSPIPNMRAYILDKHHHVQPAGLPGEIYLSGIGLSAGYYHRDDLTVARFIEHPFYPGERLYATGDLGKYTASGELVCFGRSDHQVKIRGYRVELSEIEQCIISSGIVQECCVVYRTDSAGDGFLAAFVTDENVDIIQLRGFLELNLPDYMVPRSVVRLVQLPLTANGKTDRQQLGVYELGLEEGGSVAEYVAASGGLELELQRIWEEVLDVHPVSVTENFFRLGGHSLKALRVLNAVSRDLEMKLTLNEFFRYPVIRDLSAYLSGKDKVGYEAIAAAPVLDYYPLSHAQKRLWILQQLTATQQAYNIPYYIHVKGILDPALLQDALQQLVNRHEVLRTVFDVVNDEPVQKIIPASLFSVNLLYDDVSGSADALFLCDEIAASESGYAFDLLNGPLLRVRLVKTGNASSALCFTLHHIVFDGWSVQVLLGELLRVYHGLATGNTYRLPELDIQYKDYAVWQEEQLLSGKFSAARSYWHQLFSGELPVLELPADYPRAAVKNYEGKSYRVSLPASVNAGLTAYSAEAGVSLFMLLLSGVQILLSKYSGQEDIIVGTPVSGRDHAGLSDQIGFYVNTLAVRDFVDGKQSFHEYLRVAKDRLLAAYDHQGYPFDKLVEELGLSGDGSRSPLFDVMVVMEHAASTESLFELNNLEVLFGERVTTTSKFDMTFHFTASSSDIGLAIEYNTSLYKASRIERMGAHLVNILQAVVCDPQQRIRDIVYLSASEEQEVLQFSGEVHAVPDDLSVPVILHEVVQLHGDAIALSDGAVSYTYTELWHRSGLLSGFLQQECHVWPESLVGIVMGRGTGFVLAMTGILRSGAGYLPIESHLPQDRIRRLLKAGGVSVVVTDAADVASWLGEEFTCVLLSDALSKGIATPDDDFRSSAASLAYIMFTSGSTGEPKGVMVEHRSIVRLVKDTNYVSLNSSDRILQTGSLSFDAATFEIWGALLNGGAVYVTALENLLDATELAGYISGYGISCMWFTSSWFNQLADESPALFAGLKQVLVGGEQLSVSHVGKVMHHCPAVRIVNGYGPTENTTFSVCGEVLPSDIAEGVIRLGYPVSKSRVYITDVYRKLVGKGVYGELLLGGEGVSRGYLNDALRTETSFIANPFVPGERVYRSGDIGCWDEDGRILFRGRRDNQVKIRGYRVEPQEIARVLEEHESVREAAVKVVVSAVGDKQLAAYYTGEEGAVAAIRLHLEKHLPSYMRPAYLQWLPVFVLNANGKTDMGALPAPVMEEVAYIAASSELESYLVEVWSEVLHIATTDLSVEANFFELGGQSLKAIALIGRIHRDRGIKIPLVELFTHATIRSLASYLSVQSQVVYAGLVAAPVSDYYPVSYAQRRMYLLQQFDTFSTAYNIPLQLPLPGGYGIEEVGAALQALVNRHEILRTSFEEREGVPVQIVQASVVLSVTAYGDTMPVDFVKPFDLSVAPLLRAGYYNGELGGVLLLDIHHIITDGLSQAILQDEFIRILSGETLAPVVFQYKDFAVHEQSAAGQLPLANDGAYWTDRLSGELPMLELPIDFARPEVRSLQGASAGVRLSADEVLLLRRLCSEEEVTLYMAGLSLWLLLLWRVSGQEDIITGTPVSGRQHADLSGIVGLFVNTLAIRSRIQAGKRYVEYLSDLKQEVLSDFEHEGYPFELLLEAVWPHRDRSRHPLFDTMFSVQNKNAFWQEMGEDGEVSAEISEAFFTDRGGKFDLNLRLVEYGEDIYLHLGYNTTLFTVETAHALLDGYRELMASLQADKLQYLFDLQLLSPASRLLLSTAPLLDSPAPVNTYSSVFEGRAAKSGDTIAVKDENGFLSYADLNCKANQLAHYLYSNGIVAGSVVGVLLPPCKEMMVGIIGIFKAGCAYLPIDTSQPAARIEHILSDSDVDCVVTVGELPEGLEYSGMIVDLLSPSLQEQPVNNLLLPQDVDQLAYVIYTSGSTGRPKGVPIAQKSLMNYVNWFIEEVQYDESDSTILTSSFSFDLGHTVLFPVLLCGGCLHIVSKDLYLSPADLCRYVQSAGISFLKFTPTLFSMLLNSADFEPSWLSGIRILMLGGEMIHVKDVGRFLSLYPDKYVLNSYGPAEATAGSVYKRIDRHNYDSFASRVVIGSPIPNMRAYILDKHHHVQPAGLPGEIYLSGIGLSAGYYHRDDLTVARFIEHPFYPGERLYATGDLGKYTASGELVCFGRSDHQVKIRGYRVELSEIEQCIISSGIVQECCVVYRTDSAGDGFLAAFVTDENVDIIQLRGFLELNLPDYMVPRSVVRLGQLPLTANGKTDRQQLGVYELGLEEGGSGAEYVAASGGLELELQRIWEEVLDVHPVSVAENFFRLGGHSLKALRVLNAVSRDLEMKLTLNEFFRYPVIRELSAYLSGKDKVGYEAIAAAPVLDYYPLSHAQKRLWILQQLAEERQAYNVPKVFYLQGVPDVDRLRHSFELLVQRHDILRTVFRVVNGEVKQHIVRKDLLPDCFQVVTMLQLRDAGVTSDEFIHKRINKAFDLENGPLLQVYLVQQQKQAYTLLINMHHIIADAWSMKILLSELVAFYNTPEVLLPLLSIQYKDYAWWEAEYLESDHGQRHRKFWMETLHGDIARIHLPEKANRPARKTFNGSSCGYQFSNTLTQRLKGMAADEGTSMFVLLMAAFNALFYRYLGIDDMVIGTVVAGREREELLQQVGFYVNTLAVRNRFSGQDSFIKLLGKVKENVLLALEHQYYPFDRIVSDLGGAADADRQSLFDIMLVYQNQEEWTEGALEIEGMTLQPGKGELEGSKFDISFVVSERETGLHFYIEYNTDIYEGAFMLQLMGHLKLLLESVLQLPEKPIAYLDYLPGEEHQLLLQFNSTAFAEALHFPAIQCYFENQAVHFPDNAAIISGDRVWSYRQVNEITNRLAHWIRSEYSDRVDRVIAFVADRSEWQVMLMLGILKSGAAFLPIDPTNPSERIVFMLNDAMPLLVITDTEEVTWLAAVTSKVIGLEVIIDQLPGYAATNPVLLNTPEDMAYVIYTSGSTGRPKGVVIEHRGTINLAHDQVRRFAITPADRSLQFATVSFDAAIYEIFMALFSAAGVVVVAQEVINQPVAFVQYLQQCGVTIATLPPVYLASLGKQVLQPLRILVTAGEAPGKEYAAYHSTYLDYYNAYGPTEYSVCTSIYQVAGNEVIIPIGKPLINTQVYILDQHQQLLPQGFWGEITVSGKGIARGYLNRPDLTKEKFIDHPFIPGEKLYRTGDIGRWTPEGDIVFAGRRDNLVKIRGYRVELAEIEQVLLLHPDVSTVAVTYRKEAGSRDVLSAYIESDASNDIAALKWWLAQKLPYYMIPGYFFFMKAIPLTASGKINYGALPVELTGDAVEQVSPVNAIEVLLLEIWQEVLQLKNISTEDDFFAIGGHSILAMRFMSLLWERMNKTVSIRDLVKYPTIRSLAEFINRDSSDKGLLLPLNRVSGNDLPLFMIPPVVGSSTVFTALAAALEEKEIRCYGLQYRGFDYDVPFDESMQVMAESFAAEIISAGTGQKIYVLGYSMGALLAVETVRSLERKGYTAGLILLDKDPSAGWSDFDVRNAKEEDALLEIFQLHFSHQQQVEFKDMDRLQRLLAHNISLLQSYRTVGKIKADILALEALDSSKQNKMRKWKTRTSGSFEHQLCEGNHFSLIQDSNIPTLTDFISQFVINH